MSSTNLATNKKINDPSAQLGGADPNFLRIVNDVELTNAYQYSDIVDISNCKSFILGFILTSGANTACNIQLQFMDDSEQSAEFLPLYGLTLAGGVFLYEFDLGSSDITCGIPFINPGARKLRVGFKGTASAGAIRILIGRGNGPGMLIQRLTS